MILDEATSSSRVYQKKFRCFLRKHELDQITGAAPRSRTDYAEADPFGLAVFYRSLPLAKSSAREKKSIMFIGVIAPSGALSIMPVRRLAATMPPNAP